MKIEVMLCQIFENILFRTIASLFSSSFLLLLVLVQVVFLGKLHVPKKLGVHALQLDALLGGRLPSRIPVVLTGLIVIGVILRLSHISAAKKKKQLFDVH